MRLLGSNYTDVRHKQKPVFYILCYVYAAVLCVGAFVGLFILRGRQEPMYQAKVNFVLVNSDSQGYLADADMTVSRSLVDTCVTIIESDICLEKVIESGNFHYSTDELREKITAQQVDDTEVFTVGVTDPNPKMAARIANTIAEIAPGEVENIIVGSSVKVIDFAKEPEAPVSSQNVWKDAVLGALVATVLVVVIPGICYVIRLYIKRKTAERKTYERRSQ